MANTRFKGPIVVTGTGTGTNAGNQTIAGTLAVTGTTTLGASGTALKQVKYGSVAVNPASIAATTSAETAVTITGVAVGDVVIMIPPASLENDICFSGARVSAADTVQLRLSNIDNTNAVDGASLTWEYIWIDLT